MKNIITIIFLFTQLVLSAQTTRKYWITFTDKPFTSDNNQFVSNQTLLNRQGLSLPMKQWTDFPVSKLYVDSLSKLVHKVRVHSKWLNAISVEASDQEINGLANISFVESIEKLSSNLILSYCSEAKDTDFGTAIFQMKADAFQKAGLIGENVIIGVIDAGFFKADRDPYLLHIFEEKRVLGYRDYVSPNKRDFFGISGDNSTHGTTVLSMIAGLNKSYQKGMATGAKFYLARTDDDDTEYRIEEDYWIAAIEWMDSLGVRLVNTSLGYALGHTLPEEDYQPWQMDGKTTKITKAAQIAAQEKGMILINSAGNEGEESRWGIIAAPADARDVISIGATNILGEKAGYSSIGTKELPYLKPEVSCFSLNGTSFSAPAITGFVACMLQLEPSMTREKVRDILQKSAHLYPYGNNYLGYGIPNAKKAYDLLTLQAHKPLSPSLKKAVGKTKIHIKLQNKTTNRVILFHKEDPRIVKLQVSSNSINKGKLMLTKPKGVTHTTVVAGEEVIEVVW